MEEKIFDCAFCHGQAATAIRGLRRNLEASIWCPNCVANSVVTLPCLERTFTGVRVAMLQAEMNWNHLQGLTSARLSNLDDPQRGGKEGE